mmetsp:Transcript_7853/g.11560  ORF Transcript_7853/g.11560 Transcript_7853/m.11560 type:complete len:94 (-) Transcript_7853:388-669(-)
MGCEACQSHVKGVLDRSGGVIASSVDFNTGRAEVYVAKGWGNFNMSAVSEQLEYDGYMIDIISDIPHTNSPTNSPTNAPTDSPVTSSSSNTEL